MLMIQSAIFLILTSFALSNTALSTESSELFAKVNLVCGDRECSRATIHIQADRNQISLSLQLNTLLTSTFFKAFIQRGRSAEIIDKLKHCHYIQKPGNEVASVSTCGGKIKGTFQLQGTFYEIVYDQKYDQYKIVKQINEISLCNNDIANNDVVQGRANHGSSGHKYIEALIVNDHILLETFKADLNQVEEYTINIINQANAILSEIGLIIVIVKIMQIDVEPENYPIDGSSYVDVYNYYDTEWIKSLGSDTINYDAIILLKGIKEKDSQSLGPEGMTQNKGICGRHYLFIHVENRGNVPINLVHQLGHYLGLDHTTSECTDANNTCYMCPNAVRDHWTRCSKEKLKDILSSDRTVCLNNVPDGLNRASYCGNGLIEPGEACDCHPSDMDCMKCCNMKVPTKCTLFNGAECSKEPCCNSTTCQVIKFSSISPQNQFVCRPSMDRQCDEVEYCNGVTSGCPNDFTAINDKPCVNEESYANLSKVEATCWYGRCLQIGDVRRTLPPPAPTDSWWPSTNGGRRNSSKKAFWRSENNYMWVVIVLIIVMTAAVLATASYFYCKNHKHWTSNK